MKSRKWTPQDKTLIVMEGLRGQTVGRICSEHGICQSQYYRWRDTFLSNAHQAFSDNRPDAGFARLRQENKRLKQIIGDLSLELKKNGEVFE